MTEVHAATPREGPRLLDEHDEPAFVALLRAVYGDTYSYRALYEPGGMTALVRTGRAALFGDVGPGGEIFSHTAFLLKDPHGDYVESGMSFRGPRARHGTSDAVIWRHLFAWLTPRVALVHQNTSTWHALAQRYAERHMQARPTGLIVDYVTGERLVGMPVPHGPMQALTMTTVVHPERLRPASEPRVVPARPWGAWIATLLRSMGASSFVEAARDIPSSLGLEAIEHNPSIGLTRRAVIASTESRLGDALGMAASRTDLVHLPCDGRMSAFPVLQAAGFVPVGVRVHVSRPDEVVLQRLPGSRRREAIEALASAQLIASARPLIAGWRATCAQTS